MGKVRGRPTGSQGPKKVSAGKSRLNTKCAVCSLTKRADKIKDHQVNCVLWSEDGSSAADESHPGISKKLNIGEELILEIYHVGEKLICFLYTCGRWSKKRKSRTSESERLYT